MNHNEVDKNELGKSENLNESNNDKIPTTSKETAPLTEVLIEIENEEHAEGTSVGDSMVKERWVANFSEYPSNLKSQSSMPLECATIDDATANTKEIEKDATVNLFCCERSTSEHIDSTAESLLVTAQENLLDATGSQMCGAQPEDDITISSATANDLITLIRTKTASATEAIASPLTPLASDIPQLHHVASAPVMSCVPMRANQQQQKKIKSYHDAKQTALWDTKSSTSSGGAILKSGISSTYGSTKTLRKLSDSSSCAILPRRVSFPKSDNELVTGYCEPANPWEHVSTVSSVSEIADLYIKSSHKHNTKPLPEILDQLKAVELNKLTRQPKLSLKNVQLQAGDCEALEEILKRVQYKYIDLSSCLMEENASSTIFEIIGYYEAANELNISTNPKGMTLRGWNLCAQMIARSQELQILNADGNPISKLNAEQLGHGLSTSNLHTMKLEHCGLKDVPLNSLCTKIRQNKVLKELWLGHNDLDSRDAKNIADLLKVNHYLEFLDISNNNIGDEGLKLIVKALKAQSKELEKRSVFQRAAAIDDDIFSPIETSSDESCQLQSCTEDHEMSQSLQVTSESSSNEGKFDEISKDNDNNDTGDECSQGDYATEVLIPDLDALITEKDTISPKVTSLTIEETEGEDDTENTVKLNNSTKSKHQSSVASGGQSMLDKLLSMNSDSSSEEGASNLSTDTIAACGSDDTSFVSDDIFDVTTTNTTTSNTCTNSKVNSSTSTKSSTDAMMISFGSPVNIPNDNVQKNGKNVVFGEKMDSCDTCTLEANSQCDFIDDERKESKNSLTSQCCHNNYNNNTNNNINNNNINIVQSPQNDFRELTHNQETHKERQQSNIGEGSHANISVFEVTAVESDCTLPCASSSKSNALLVQTNSNPVDVNKNTRVTEDCDDTHSTDSAFESASEGDISRTLPEEFTRLSTSLESTRLEDASKELTIETATIATESTEYLAETGETTVSLPSVTTPSLRKIGTQKSDEVKTKGPEVRFCETVLMEPNSDSQTVSSGGDHEVLLPKVTIETAPVTSVKLCGDNNSPIPTPPPPSTSPGGASLSMRRTDSSCNFSMQATRNHSQSSESLCSEISLDGSVSNDLNISTSAQLNEKFTKNDTLTRQQRQYDSITESSNRPPGGLKALAVWNNNLTKEAGLYVSDLLADTTSLELLNIGKNCLSNDFVFQIKESLKKNTTLTTLGLQSAHLSAKGIEALSSVLAFGGNSTLQRIDIRDNKLEVESLTTLADALKSNTTVSQIDIDDEPKRLSIGSDAHLDYVRVVENIRSMCSRNEKTQAQLQAEKTVSSASSNKRRGGYYVGSRKISLTCHSRPLIEYSVASAVTMPPSTTNKLEVKRKTGVRLRSPQPSPPTMSPSSSPNRSRFQVYRVNEVSPLTSPAGNNTPLPTLSCSADFQQKCTTSALSLTTSTSLPSMATATSSTQTIRRHGDSPRSRFHVSKIYEDPKVPLAKRSLPPITPPIHLPPSPMIKSAPKNDKLNSNESSEIEKEVCIDSQTTPLNPTIDTTVANDANENVPSSRCPIAVFNENDITLTHSSAKEVLLSSNISICCNEAKTKEDAPTEDNTSLTASTAPQQVVRKVSWIGNPAAVEKLLTLFQNSGTFFQRSSSPEPKNTTTNNTSVTSSSETRNSMSQTIQTTSQVQQSLVSTVKQSSPKRSKHGSDALTVSVTDPDKTLTNEPPKSFLGVASKQLRDLSKQVFRQNTASVSESTSIGTITDNLLNMTAGVSTQISDDAVKVYSTPTDCNIECTESSLLEMMHDDNRIHHMHNPKASEDQTKIEVSTTKVNKMEGEKGRDELGTK